MVHWDYLFIKVSKCYHFCGIIFRVLSFMSSFDVIIFHGQQMISFYVIIFPCTYFVLPFMFSFDVIIYCYHFPLFSFSWKRDTLFLYSILIFHSKRWISTNMSSDHQSFVQVHILRWFLNSLFSEWNKEDIATVASCRKTACSSGILLPFYMGAFTIILTWMCWHEVEISPVAVPGSVLYSKPYLETSKGPIQRVI